jgi:hypothetical protein
MLYIFGYGSLLFPLGINGRGLSRVYEDKDLIDAWITGYRREWNACWNERFLGLVQDHARLVNGVIFPLNDKDFSRFASSEGSSLSNPNPVYKFVDIRIQLGIDPEADVVLTPNDKVLACVTNKPSYEGKVSERYLNLIKLAAHSRGGSFESEFWATTPRLPNA